MAQDEKKVRHIIEDMAADMERQLDSHPGAETLADFMDGLLPEAEMDAIRAHTAVCGKCLKTLDAMAAPLDAETQALLDDRELLAARWAGMQRELSSAEPATPPPLPFYATLGFARLAAALFLTMSIGLGVALYRQAGAIRAPEANTLTVGLNPSGAAVTRDARTLTSVPLHSGVRRIALQLNLANLDDYPVYSVRVWPAEADAGAPLWRDDGLARLPGGGFSISFPAETLPPGRYRLAVIGMDREAETTLAEYAFELTPK